MSPGEMHSTAPIDVTTALLEGRPRGTYLDRSAPILLDGRTARKEPTWKQSLIAALFQPGCLNLLLPVVPIFFYMFAVSPPIKHLVDVQFALGLLSLVPLSRSLALVVDDLAMRMHRGVGRLWRCFMGNAIEMAIAIISVWFCQIKLATAMLIGTVLVNTLFVLGLAFALSGYHSSSRYHLSSAGSLSTALVVSVFAMLVPAAFDIGFSSDIPIEKGAKDVLRMSRGIAVLLLLLYGVVIFTLYTHEHFSYDAVSANGQFTTRSRSFRPSEIETPREAPAISRRTSTLDFENEKGFNEPSETEEEEGTPTMNLGMSIIALVFFAFALLVVVFGTIQLVAGFIAEHPSFNEEYLGLIIIPLILNLSEQMPNLCKSVHGSIDEVMAIALGKSVQLALGIVPLVILISAGMGRPVSLLFNTFENVVLFLAIMTVSIILRRGRTNLLDGILLLSMYAVIALSFWFYPHGGVGGSKIEHYLQCSAAQVDYLVQRYGLEPAVEKAAAYAAGGGAAH